MFKSTTYSNRRQQLANDIEEKGLLVIFGNEDSPMNYSDNIYAFRQDSNFLYFAGLNMAHLILCIDLENGKSTLFGDELSLDHIVWMGPQPSLGDQAATVGIQHLGSYQEGLKLIRSTHKKGAKVHYLPPYRADRLLLLSETLGASSTGIQKNASLELTKAVIKQRSYKSNEEVLEMEKAVLVTKSMHLSAMKAAKAGQKEAHIAGIAEGIAVGSGGRLSYPCIATINGHILHNHYHGNTLKEGDLLLLDAGASAASMYAGDITRTFPVSSSFTAQQKEIYQIVLDAEDQCIHALKPGISFKSIHLQAATIITEGLISLGLMKGDTAEAVEQGAHALFFPHGLGHMIGLDVHDMEDLGENLVGYDEQISRSDQFGLNALRLGKKLESGFVLTVEPGVYFIPTLIDQWKADKKHNAFICYDKLDGYRDFGGIRIEDNIQITDKGYHILGDPIPKSILDIEGLRGR